MSGHRDHKLHVVRSAIVTAFTLAVALIWRDVIVSAIETFFPSQDALHAQFFTAVLATALVIIFLKLFISGEEKAEKVIEEVEEMMDHHEHPNSHHKK